MTLVHSSSSFWSGVKQSAVVRLLPAVLILSGLGNAFAGAANVMGGGQPPVLVVGGWPGEDDPQEPDQPEAPLPPVDVQYPAVMPALPDCSDLSDIVGDAGQWGHLVAEVGERYREVAMAAGHASMNAAGAAGADFFDAPPVVAALHALNTFYNTGMNGAFLLVAHNWTNQGGDQAALIALRAEIDAHLGPWADEMPNIVLENLHDDYGDAF